MKILIVEDSPTLRAALCAYVEAAGHQTTIAESGEQALQSVSSELPDMIIMDVEMPGLDGFETTLLIRQRLKDHWVPIIFVTGKSDDDSYQQGIDAGGDDYLTKPVSPIILKAKIQAMERITEMRNRMNELNEELTRLSQIDTLTQLYNRRAFSEQSELQWLQAGRLQNPVTLLMMDIDHFKLYNDHYGHPAGDVCIKEVSRTIKETLNRPCDIVGRYGGEEFVVILPDTDTEGARIVAENIRAAVEALNITHVKSQTADMLTISIGGASCSSTTGRSVEGMIKYADNALYKSKHSGRNSVYIEKTEHNKTVLVVDDDQSAIDFLSISLSKHCNVLTASSGMECLEITRHHLPDLILLDISMPGLEGTDVCKQLKNNKGTASIPIMLVSALERSELVKRGKEAGANDCLQKPLNEELLVRKVNSFIR